MKSIIAGIIILAFVLAFSAGQVEARFGGAGAQFLAVGGGSRPLALGGAYTALADGIDAIFWNPAGLAELERMTTSFTHTSLFAGVKEEHLALAFPRSGGVLGVSAIALLSGSMPITTLEDQDGTSGHTFSANDFAFGLSYARRMTDKFTAGVTWKFIDQNIWQCSAYGWAFDIGGLYNTGIRNLKIGFVIQNFGPDMKYVGEGLEYLTAPDPDHQSHDVTASFQSEAYSLPLSFQMGVAYDLFNTSSNKLTASVEAVHPIDQDQTYASGVEYWYNNTYALRIGYTEKNNKGFTGGLGIRLPLRSNIKAEVDYSYEDHQYLSGIQHFTIKIEY